MRIVILDDDVIISKIENRCDGRIEFEARQRSWRSRQLFARLIEMIEIEMRVAECMHEVAGREAADLRDHVGQKRIARYIEGNAEKHIA